MTATIGRKVAAGLALAASLAGAEVGMAQVTVTWTQQVAGAYAWTDPNWDLRVPGNGGNSTDVATFPTTIGHQIVTYSATGPYFRQLALLASNTTVVIDAPMTNLTAMRVDGSAVDRGNRVTFGGNARYVTTQNGNTSLNYTRMLVEPGAYAHMVSAYWNQNITLNYCSLTNRGRFIVGYGNYDWYRVNNWLTLSGTRVVTTDGGWFEPFALSMTGTGSSLWVTNGAVVMCRMGMNVGGSAAGEYVTTVDLADGTITNSRGPLNLATANSAANRAGRGTVTIHSGVFDQGGAAIVGVARVGTLSVRGGALKARCDVYVGGGLNQTVAMPVAPASATGILHVTGGTVTITNAPRSSSATVYTGNYYWLFTQANSPIYWGQRVILTNAHPDLLTFGWQLGRTYYAQDVRSPTLFGLATNLAAVAINSGIDNKSKGIWYITFPAQLRVGNWTRFSDGVRQIPGLLKMEGGTVTVDEFMATNGAASRIEFTGGTLNVKKSAVDMDSAMVVGGGAGLATLNLQGGVHAFADGLQMASNAALTVGGSGIGGATVVGDLAFGAGSTFRVNLTSNACDRLSVTGGVSVSGATLSVSVTNFTPERGTAFLILDNDGADPVNGRFLNSTIAVSWNGATHRLCVEYQGGDGNDIILAPPKGTVLMIR